MTLVAPPMSRRAVIKGAGALTIAFALVPVVSAAGSHAALPSSLRKTPALDAWLRINADGSVTVFTGKAEIGQGIATPLAQIAADELDVAIERVRMVTADTHRTPDEGYTFGSLSIRQSGMAIRMAAAEARAILVEAAAERLGISSSKLTVNDGNVLGGGKSISYWVLVDGKLLRRAATGAATPKPPGDRRYAGSPVPRLDIPDKAFGKASFLQDIRLPGMLHGRITRPAYHDAELLSVDLAIVRALPGVVRVVRDGRFLGVIAEREHQAVAAAEALAEAAVWKGGKAQQALTDNNIIAHIQTRPGETALLSEVPAIGKSRISARISARYTRPFQAHASMGPSAAIAHFEGEGLTVWSHSQGVFPLRGALSGVLGLAPENIHVIHAAGAGCYGHNGADDAALDAALLARAVPGRPVRLQWSRQDEFGWEPLGPAMVINVSAEVAPGGRIRDWSFDVAGFPHTTRPGGRPGNLLAAQHIADPLPQRPPYNIPQPSGGLDRNAVPPYSVDGHRITEHFIAKTPLRSSALRSLGAYANVFAIDSFIDELATRADEDPVSFRLRHLEDARARAVIEEAARRSGWGRPLKSVDGVLRGRGMAYSRYKGSGGYFAVVAEVSVDASSGEIVVQRAVGAADCGEIINPDGARNQIEGGIVQSTSWTLLEAVSFDETGVTSTDWASYPILTFENVPEVEVHLMDRAAESPLGTGEVAQGPMAAAIANAVYDAAGIRLRDLPLTPDKVLAALQLKEK